MWERERQRVNDHIRASRHWATSYRGIYVEVVHHSVNMFSPYGIWCGYLSFWQNQNPEIVNFRGTVESGLIGTRDKHNEFFDQFDWNGGVTFYEEKLSIDGVVWMKVGCDYAHIWDEDTSPLYNEEWILNDMRSLVDEYRKIYPESESE